MSLDLTGKSGFTTAGTAAAGLTSAALTDAQVADGNLNEANIVQVFVDTSGGDVDIDAAAQTAIAALTGIEEGDKFAFTKATADNGKILFTDPVSAFSYNYVNRQTETLCVVFDGTQLVASF